MVVVMSKFCYCKHFLLSFAMLLVAVLAKHHGNPANELVDIINENRTAHKLPKLHDSPGLGCMALQYLDECTGNCTSNHTVNCQPPEVDVTEVYAPNCGVELPTVDIISGRLIGCQSKYLEPAQAFSDVLARDKKTLSLLHNNGHTEVGVGLVRGPHRGSFFWCVLFSSGQTNSTFVFEGGKGIKQKRGCFSGMDIQCSAGQKLLLLHGFSALVFAFIIYFISSNIICF